MYILYICIYVYQTGIVYIYVYREYFMESAGVQYLRTSC